jgi:hypothetical protein
MANRASSPQNSDPPVGKIEQGLFNRLAPKCSSIELQFIEFLPILGFPTLARMVLRTFSRKITNAAMVRTA